MKASDIRIVFCNDCGRGVRTSCNEYICSCGTTLISEGRLLETASYKVDIKKDTESVKPAVKTPPRNLIYDTIKEQSKTPFLRKKVVKPTTKNS